MTKANQAQVDPFSLLPKIKEKPKVQLEKQKVLIHGDPKVGKTTFASQFPEPLFLKFEEGLNALEAYQVAIKNWTMLKQLISQIELGGEKLPYKTIVLDVVDGAYDMCQQYICSLYSTKDNQLQHISQIAHGQGYGRCDSEFSAVMQKLLMLPLGVVFISHTKQIEIDTAVGSFQKMTPTVNKRVAQWLIGKCDILLYFHAEMSKDKATGKITEKRIIRTRKSQFYDAGSRFPIDDPLPLSFSAFFESYSKNYNKSK